MNTVLKKQALYLDFSGHPCIFLYPCLLQGKVAQYRPVMSDWKLSGVSAWKEDLQARLCQRRQWQATHEPYLLFTSLYTQGSPSPSSSRWFNFHHVPFGFQVMFVYP